MVDLKQEKERLGEKLKELEDKSHQLNMCQHHLQVSTIYICLCKSSQIT